MRSRYVFTLLLVMTLYLGCERHSSSRKTNGIQDVGEVASRVPQQDDSDQRRGSPEGRGPGMRGDQYDQIVANPFHSVSAAPLSTFSIDVDTAAYTKTRALILGQGVLPPPDAIRIEEFVNYFAYDYPNPRDDLPFSADVEIARCPWHQHHHLARIGIQGRSVLGHQRPASNLVFLLDVSGSMDYPNKLPLLQRGMKMLVGKLTERDRVSIVVYAGGAGRVLPSTSGDAKRRIAQAIDDLRAGGSTNGGAGIQLAYDLARENFVDGGVNRVILCTDGDFNVGTTSTGALIRLAEKNAKTGVYLTVLGFGTGNLNDSLLEQLSNKANGNYAFIDSDYEARKVLVDQLTATLVPIAKDVKIQVEFNPATVQGYRLLGYENRLLAAREFNDDKKDAGEIGAGHCVTALYEIVPAGTDLSTDGGSVDPLRYQNPSTRTLAARRGEALWVKIRYKRPEQDDSQLLTVAASITDREFATASADYQFAAAVASFGMLLRGSEFKGSSDFDAVLEMAREGAKIDPAGYRAEFLRMVLTAKGLSRRQLMSPPSNVRVDQAADARRYD